MVPLRAWTPLNCCQAATKPKRPGRTIVGHKGRVVFGAMDEVVFGTAAAEAVVGQMDRLGTSRAFLMVSGTLNRRTDEIEKIRKARLPSMRCRRTRPVKPSWPPTSRPVPPTPLIVTVGGGSITDGAKAVQ